MKNEAAIGTWQLAETYLDAGNRLCLELKLLEYSIPGYFLFGHAIELAFKSFLISQGATEKDLKDIGHDLEAAMNAAYSCDAFDVFLGERQKAVIRVLNPYYRGKELEYLVVGAKSFPDIAEVEATTHALVSGAKPCVEAAVRCPPPSTPPPVPAPGSPTS